MAKLKLILLKQISIGYLLIVLISMAYRFAVTTLKTMLWVKYFAKAKEYEWDSRNLMKLSPDRFTWLSKNQLEIIENKTSP